KTDKPGIFEIIRGSRFTGDHLCGYKTLQALSRSNFSRKLHGGNECCGDDRVQTLFGRLLCGDIKAFTIKVLNRNQTGERFVTAHVSECGVNLRQLERSCFQCAKSDGWQTLNFSFKACGVESVTNGIDAHLLSQ